ncbi:MAG: type 1 glutamine amidotransferase [Verrucomicrobiales bacterium]|nr:type 1 glutamine amidotransferase [Verrucomicrobiales bacterium]
MRVAVLENHPAEGAGLIGEWAKENGVEIEVYEAFQNRFPSVQEYDALIVMGGPASVSDVDSDEAVSRAIETIEKFLNHDKGLLGICLGAQMMAVAAGGNVIGGPEKEIGWYPISVPPGNETGLLADVPDDLVVFHWHGDQIELAPAAELFASSHVCPVQAFQLGEKQLGLQCHLEVDSAAMDKMMEAFADEVRSGGPNVMTAVEMTSGLHRWGGDCRSALFRILDRWSKAVSG